MNLLLDSKAAIAHIEELIANNVRIDREDIDILQRLQVEFAKELSTIAGRIDALEARSAFLEDNQFSTTTKLEGAVIFSVSDVFGGCRRGEITTQ
ncbi:MAG: carbohydrate porin [Hydrococcus sp. CSU_1_8]|nr:carbohydrate porin [Hydrococcus sp. CSU_1_8]